MMRNTIWDYLSFLKLLMSFISNDRQVEDKNHGERGTCPHLIQSMVLLYYMRSSPFLDLLSLIPGPLQHTAPLTSVPLSCGYL